MPWIIDYQLVLEQMREQRFKCLYYNSGAFAFPPDVKTRSAGWIGPPDDSIKPVDKDVFARELSYYQIRSDSK